MALDVRRTEGSGIDVSERGRGADGNAISLDRRLFMQLLVFTGCFNNQAILESVEATHIEGILYADLNDPYGIGLLTCSETPDYFVGTLRDLLQAEPFAKLTPRPEMTMFGRTYAIGYEQDLESTLLSRPREKIANTEMPWAIWYPLRRRGSFEQLPPEEQRTVLMEHGGIGMAYGRAGLGTDIRLASYGLDQNDNDFTVALLGSELAPLSKIVERMRKTRQTSQFLSSLGPFFVGKAIWQNSNE